MRLKLHVPDLALTRASRCSATKPVSILSETDNSNDSDDSDGSEDETDISSMPMCDALETAGVLDARDLKDAQFSIEQTGTIVDADPHDFAVYLSTVNEYSVTIPSGHCQRILYDQSAPGEVPFLLCCRGESCPPSRRSYQCTVDGCELGFS